MRQLFLATTTCSRTAGTGGLIAMYGKAGCPGCPGSFASGCPLASIPAGLGGAVPTSELFGEFVYRSRLGGRGDVSVGVLIVDVVHLW